MSKQVSYETCHACSQKMKFELDLSLDGNHVLECPECGHEHCRRIENGKVTSDRWDSRNNVQVFYPVVYTVSYDAASCTAGTTYTLSSWANSTGGYY